MSIALVGFGIGFGGGFIGGLLLPMGIVKFIEFMNIWVSAFI